jgi:hypothetical protein
MEIKNPFALPTPDTLRKQQLEHAQRELLMYEAAVEQNAAHVAMYRARIARLSGSSVALAHPASKGVVSR